MSVLVMSQHFHPEPNGSAPPITDFAQWLAEAGHSLRVVTARPNYPDRRVFDGYRKGERDHEIWSGVKIERLNLWVAPGAGMLSRLITEGSFALALLMKRLGGRPPSGPVISVCPSVFVVLIASLFVRKPARHVCIVHDIQSGLGASTGGPALAMAALRRLERFALSRADAIITLSDEMRARLLDLGVKRPITVLPPQVDTRQYVPLPDPGVALALYSGAMGRKQGLHQLIALAEALKAMNSPVRILVRGQGGVRPELEREARTRGLANITFEDLAPAGELSRAMAMGSVHLVPQAPQGADFAVPSKVFSIMASARPFIATAHEGTPLARLAADSGAGVCVPPDDAPSLARALQGLIDDPARRQTMGARGRRYVETHAGRDSVCRAIWSLAAGADGPASAAEQSGAGIS